MSRFHFCYYQDFEDGVMARVETVGENGGIPVNIYIDNPGQYPDLEEGPCLIDLYGAGNEFAVYPDEASYYAAMKDPFAASSMIPLGTFPHGSEDGDPAEDHDILFSGKVTAVEHLPVGEEPAPNICIGIETVGLEFDLYTVYDGPVDVGCIIHGTAWMYGVITPAEE